MNTKRQPLPLFLIGLLLIMLGVIWGSVEGQGYLPRLALVTGVLLLLVFLVRHGAEIKFLFLQTRSHSEPGPTITLLLLALLITLGGFVADRQLQYIDLTEKKINSLSPATRQTLSALRADVSIDGFYIENSSQWNLARRFLDIYKRSSVKIATSLSDPDRVPAKAGEAGVTRSGVMVISSIQARTEVWDLTEDAITQGILRVLEGRPRRIGLVQGHGEPGRDTGGEQGLTGLVQTLAKENIEVLDINLLSNPQLLPALDALMIVHPQTTLYQTEVNTVIDFLEEGKGVGLWLEPGDSTGLEDYLGMHAVTLPAGIIRDYGPVTDRIGQGPWAPALATNPFLPIGLKLKGVFISAPYVRTVEIAKSPPMFLDIHPLLMTTQSAELVPDNQNPDEEAIYTGAMKAGAVLEWEVAVQHAWDPEGDDQGLPPVKPTARMLVAGDASLLTNRYLGVTYNSSLVANCAHWLTWQARFLGINTQTREHSRMKLTRGELRSLFFVVQIGIPLIMILAGVGYWFRRRSRA
jgi:ABC-type uncharacterized transport system